MALHTLAEYTPTLIGERGYKGKVIKIVKEVIGLYRLEWVKNRNRFEQIK